jgi:hypothetical protein
MSVIVVGNVEGERAPTKIKMDLKKLLVNIACYLCSPFLYVAYVDGLVKDYNIKTFAIHYT